MFKNQMLSEDQFRNTELNFEQSQWSQTVDQDWAFSGAPVAVVDNSEENVDGVEEEERLSLEELKDKLAQQLVPLHQLKPPAGVPTGIDVFDDFLLWKGFPKGDLTLIAGNPGTGATSLWINAAAQVQAQKKWVAWVNSDCELLPSALIKKNIRLEKLLVVKKPNEPSQLFWILQEMISSTLFEMIGCHLSGGQLKTHQLQKLKKLARTYNVALVFIDHDPQAKLIQNYSLVIECQGDFFVIKRAAHRPTPFTIPGGLVHADLMSQLTADTRSLLR